MDADGTAGANAFVVTAAESACWLTGLHEDMNPTADTMAAADAIRPSRSDVARALLLIFSMPASISTEFG